MGKESLLLHAESREATHSWITEFVSDHAYAHGLADDVFDLLTVLRMARARLSVNAVAWHRKHHLEHHLRIFEACDNASCVADRKVLAAIDAALEDR